MDDQAARIFIDRHKQFGNVNRQLNADVSVKLTSVRGDNELQGEIVKFVLHDPMNKNTVVETLLNKSGS